VPDAFTRGKPYESVASIWKCGSTNGGVTSEPAASISSRALAASFGSTATMRPASMPMSTGSFYCGAAPGGSIARRMIRSIYRSL
jgi:hypothetical protein